MPEFEPGESKTAAVPIRVSPAALNCEAELFLGPDDATKVATSGRVPFISTGISQNVHLQVSMPTTEGTYHVYIDLYAEGLLIGAYQATEDVVIGPAVGDFVYSNQQCGYFSYVGWPSFKEPSFSVTITNQGARGTRNITFVIKARDYGAPNIVLLFSETFELTLEPGQVYTYTFNNRPPSNPAGRKVLLIRESYYYMHVEDDAGGSTADCFIDIPY